MRIGLRVSLFNDSVPGLEKELGPMKWGADMDHKLEGICI